ncbi:MAG: hypothetical protein IKG18_02035 [Atopobiaceae bacterium]|nr:hypothetical protein [Atopobiaceae bacterium]
MGHTCSWVGRRYGSGAYQRALARDDRFYDFFDEDGQLAWKWRPRGKVIHTAWLMSDFDWAYESRGRRSTGWKERKCRHQWEHRAREEERRQRSRSR